MPSRDAEKLKKWFQKEKRTFPWRENPTPYAVWISEIMLQQTRASVVVGYFEKWMLRFPTLEELAKASEAELVKLWEGLGYYNRVRNIKKAALYFMEKHEGKIPQTYEELIEVVGFGPYTVGALLSFAFKQKAAAVDGNVSRVMSRYFLVEEDICKPVTQKKIRGFTEEFLPEKEPWVAMEALIELGAQVCGKTPDCSQCPLKAGCQAHRVGKENKLPIKKKPREMLYLCHDVIILRSGPYVLVHEKEKGKVLGGLFEFPSVDKALGQDIEEYVKKIFKVEIEWVRDLPKEEYGFTHHSVELYPGIWETRSMREVAGYQWRAFSELMTLPFSAGHKRILAKMGEDEHAHTSYRKL